MSGPKDARSSVSYLLIGRIDPAQAGLLACLQEAQPLVNAADIQLAATARDGLAALKASQHDVVLLDAATLDQPWLELTTELRASSPRSAIVVISDLPQDESIQALADGVVQDVLEPQRLSAATLQRSLHFAIARQSAVNSRPESATAVADKQHLRGVLNAVADALLIVDPDNGDCSDTNLAFERIFGMPVQTVLSQGLSCLQSSRRMHSTDQLLQFIRSQVGSGERTPAQWVFRHGTDDEAWCEVRVTAVECGPANAVLLSIHDTSTSVAAKQANKRAFAESAKAARVRRQFLANMSHEMRTPLNAILSFAQLGLGHAPPTPFDRYLGQINRSAKLMLALVNDILDLSKIESGKFELTRSAFDVIQVVNDVADSVRPGAQQAGLALQVAIEPELRPHWVGDVLRLQQVLLNLLSNAVKFTPRGEISLELRRWRDTQGGACGLEFSVIDTGSGMSVDELALLFQPFEQGDAKASRHAGGTGLGLAISSNLVEIMQGQIDVRSAPQCGTRFIVRLPLPELALPPGPVHAVTLRFVGLDDAARVACLLALGCHGLVAEVLSSWVSVVPDAVLISMSKVRAEPGGLAAALDDIPNGSLVGLLGADDTDTRVEVDSQSQLFRIPAAGTDRFAALAEALLARRARVTESVLPALAGLRVLLAEDNPVNQLIAQELLKSCGCHVTVVDDGAQAVELLVGGKVPFDVVLMDIQMPGMDGCEATRRLRQAGVVLPIIALTAHVFDEDREAAQLAGMDAYVTKPFDIADLSAAIGSIRARAAAP